jgi:putative ABC transport system permease protein
VPILRRIANLFSRQKLQREIDAELKSHIDLRIEDNIAAGMSRKQARRDALLRFGNRGLVHEQTTEADAALYLQSLWADMRFALRQLARSPGFAITAVLTLSLGVGAATAIFGVVDVVLFRPLPFANQDRLVFPFMKGRTGGSLPVSVLNYYEERAQLQTFTAMAGWSTLDRVNLVRPEGSVSLRATKTTDNFFTVFGVAPVLGRTFLPGEDQPGKDNVAVLSYEVWRANFNGNADAVGQTVKLDGNPYTIVGVMPAGFRFPLYMREAIYTPLHAPESWARARGMHWMRTVGRMKDGVTLQQAQADLDRVMANLARTYPQQEEGHTGTLIPLAAELNGFASDGKMKGPMQTLSLAVLALLGIACVNVAGLLLARGVKREREIALRSAVGASRRRLIRQMINESLVLALAGLGGGVLMSWLLLKAMNVFLVEAIARGADVSLNLKVLAVALIIATLTSVLASLAPAIRLSGADPNRVLRGGSGAGSGASLGKGQHRLRSSFVITQVALSLVLLMVSGLLLRNLQALFKTDLGFSQKKIIAVVLDLSRGNYKDRDPLLTFYHPLLDRVSHLPGVAASGVIDLLPIAEWGSGYDIHITGQPPYPKNAAMGSETRNVSPGYFDAMGVKLTRGRLLSPSLDRPGNAGSMVINEAFQRKFFSNGGDPVGAHIDDADKAEDKSGIVGVATDIRQDLQSPSMPEMDWLIDAIPPKDRMDALRNMFLMVRTDGDPKALIPSLRGVIHDIDPGVPFRSQTMEEAVNEQLTFERMESWLFGIFAAFAVLLAGIGLYGLISHEVQLRTREIGIRMALGSARSSVMMQVLRRVALLVLSGTAIGWLLTLASRKVLISVVEIHAAQDLGLLAAISVGMILVGILTSLAPARAAASIEPMEALRNE